MLCNLVDFKGIYAVLARIEICREIRVLCYFWGKNIHLCYFVRFFHVWVPTKNILKGGACNFLERMPANFFRGGFQKGSFPMICLKWNPYRYLCTLLSAACNLPPLCDPHNLQSAQFVIYSVCGAHNLLQSAQSADSTHTICKPPVSVKCSPAISSCDFKF